MNAPRLFNLYYLTEEKFVQSWVFSVYSADIANIGGRHKAYVVSRCSNFATERD
jgi:hypothetical protein